MSYLLDTCILSKLRKIKQYPDKKLETWINKHPESSYFISVLTLGEIQSGIAKLDQKNKDQKRQKMVLEDWFLGELIPRFQGRILSIDTAIALTWGKLTGACKQKGTPLPLADSLIAATAISNHLILVTENTKDFENSGAEIFNPWDF